MLTEVNNQVMQKEQRTKDDVKALQMPLPQHTLRKRVYFRTQAHPLRWQCLDKNMDFHFESIQKKVDNMDGYKGPDSTLQARIIWMPEWCVTSQGSLMPMGCVTRFLPNYDILWEKFSHHAIQLIMRCTSNYTCTRSEWCSLPSEQPHSHFMGVMFIHKTLPTHFYRSIIYQDAFRMSYRSDPVFSYTVYTSQNYLCSLI